MARPLTQSLQADVSGRTGWLSQVGGYRDLMLCLVFSGCDGLRVVGEVQVRSAHCAHTAAFRAAGRAERIASPGQETLASCLGAVLRRAAVRCELRQAGDVLESGRAYHGTVGRGCRESRCHR